MILLGPPGAGKGTQGSALAKSFGVPHVATGDMIRDQIARGTDFGRKVEAQIAAGNFVSDTDIVLWVTERLAEPDASAGFILDGFPRDVAQAEAFGGPLDVVVDLEVADDALIARLSGRLICPMCETTYHVTGRSPQRSGICDKDGTLLTRRPDDDPQAVQHRLNLYHEVTEPLQAYYQQRHLLVRVDARGEPQVITDRILNALSDRALANH